MDRIREVTQAAAPVAGTLQVGKATNVRWWILGLVIYTMAITTLNRLDLSIAGKYIGAVSTDMPSRPGEFHPEPLTDPCVSL